MKEMKTTAQVLVDCLEAEGVDVMFGIPGEETLDLMFAIRDSKIRFIPVRHEQGAAFMADVYGRLTGRAGVCLSTLGPGATNLVTGVADAYLDGAPLVAITGQVGTDRLHIPVVNTMMAKGIIPMDDKYSLWTIGIPQNDYVNQLFDRADPYSVLFYLFFVVFIFE